MRHSSLQQNWAQWMKVTKEYFWVRVQPLVIIWASPPCSRLAQALLSHRSKNMGWMNPWKKKCLSMWECGFRVISRTLRVEKKGSRSHCDEKTYWKLLAAGSQVMQELLWSQVRVFSKYYLFCKLEYHHMLLYIPSSRLQPVVRVAATVVPPFNRWRNWGSGRLLICSQAYS